MYILSEWKNTNIEPPKISGEYLTAVKNLSGGYDYRILRYAKDLYKVDNSDFSDKKGKHGWYDCDSDFEYYEWEGVVWWMELPDIPQ